MGLFSDIFDSLGSTVDSLFSSGQDLLGNSTFDKAAISLGGALFGGSSSSAASNYDSKLAGQVGSEQRIASRLQQGLIPGYNETETRVPIHSRNDFKAVESVDPMTLENEWHNRLLQYANITRQTGVSETGR